MLSFMHRYQPFRALRGVTFIVAAGMFPLAAGVPAMGSVRFDVVGAPTEVINTGRSEVLGSINLFVRGVSNVTGTSSGGAAQIGLLLSNPALPIDNTVASGIRLFSSAGFAAASPSIIAVTNQALNSQCAGFLEINLQPGATPAEGDFIRIEGVRGAIDASAAIVPGTDLFGDLQSANDPAANIFNPSHVRMAKSLKGMNVEVISNSPSYEIRIAEGFERAFVDLDAGDDGINRNDRTDSGGNALGDPSNSTQFVIRMDGIPDGITDVSWPQNSSAAGTGAVLKLRGSTFSPPSSTATYSFETVDQVNKSDLAIESFTLSPSLVFGAGRCNTDEVTTSVTLGPTSPALSQCYSPDPSAARPRFLQVFELSVLSLSPTSTVVGGKGFQLVVKGTGFVPGSTVVWNGAARATTYVSDTQLTAAITAEDIAKAGDYSVAVRNPASLGGTLATAPPFSVLPPALSLYVPRLAGPRGDAQDDPSHEFTGIALANLSPRYAHFNLTAFDRTGAAISGAGISNPAALTLAPNQQLPVLTNEIFGAGLDSTPVGWIRIEGDTPGVVGFFLSFDDAFSRLDGTDASATTLRSFVFPEVGSEGLGRINIVNPNATPAGLRLDLFQADGTAPSTGVNVTVGSNGVLAVSIKDLFPAAAPDLSDYVKVTSDEGVVPFETLGGSSGDNASLNGQDSTAGASKLYSAQYVAGPGWESIISVVNLSPQQGNVQLRLVGDDGRQVGQTRVLGIAAGGKIRVSDPAFFSGAEGGLVQGYLEVSAAGLRLAGSVIIDSPDHDTFSTALSLSSSQQYRLVFGHVASNKELFTGLALVNPNDSAARAVIQVFDKQGNQIAAKIEDLPANGRKAALLTEYFPALAGADVSSGYITVDSNFRLTGIALFGTNNLSALSSIPSR